MTPLQTRKNNLTNNGSKERYVQEELRSYGMTEAVVHGQVASLQNSSYRCSGSPKGRLKSLLNMPKKWVTIFE